MNKLYIGISGKMGSGKTTLTNGIIESLHNFVIERISMAAPIKKCQDRVYEDLGIEMVGEKDRDLLIALGMWGRGKYADFWLDQGIKEAKKSTADIIICDDVRFENEAKWFKENGLLMRIEGEQRGDNVDENNKSNITETALDNFNFDYYIDNRQGIESTLMAALYCIAQHLNVSEELMMSIAKGIKEA